MTIENAVANFLQFVSNGWNVTLAVECAHDTVYDEIGLAAFTEKCMKAVEIAAMCNLNHN